jgi:hypothetical protein
MSYGQVDPAKQPGKTSCPRQLGFAIVNPPASAVKRAPSPRRAGFRLSIEKQLKKTRSLGKKPKPSSLKLYIYQTWMNEKEKALLDAGCWIRHAFSFELSARCCLPLFNFGSL